MRKRNIIIILLVAIAGLSTYALSLEAKESASEHVQAELVTDVKSMQPGVPFWVGVHMRMAPGWHTYWENPGDAGLPTVINWKLSDGFTAGPIQWPIPERIALPPLVNFGYEGEIMLLTKITPSEKVQIGSVVAIGADVDWLECKEICIPGRAELSIFLPVREEQPDRDLYWASRFRKARARWPLKYANWEVNAHLQEEGIMLSVEPQAGSEYGLTGLTFFPADELIIENAAPQIFDVSDRGYTLYLVKSTLAASAPTQVRGVLVSPEGWDGTGTEQGLSVDAPVSRRAASSSVRETPRPVAPRAPIRTTSAAPRAPRVSRSELSFFTAVFFSFFGGLLLNLMPCVLPVLSVKIIGLVKQAGEDAKNAGRHGTYFSFGVLASFWALAILLIVFREGGAKLGWGFQLQSPYFVVAMASLFFLLGLNLFGVVEIGNALMGWGGTLVLPSGVWGTFLSGVLATIIATPCTAPFMGAALGFALTQPAWMSLFVFTALGLGMALPYFILSHSPNLLKYVPKPGMWMVTLKQFMGFPMMLTSLWLLWVLNIQIGEKGTAGVVVGLFCLGIAAWVLGQWATPKNLFTTRYKARLLAAVFLAGGIALALLSVRMAEEEERMAPPEAGEVVHTGSIAWEPFSPDRLQALRMSGKPVFIDFTAAWCISCQVNERVAFSSRAVQEKFHSLGVSTLRADWTRRNEIITRELYKHGRTGVPLYVLYPPGPKSEPIVLPEVITPNTVLDALARLE